jgi:hypothetical protein
LQESLGFQQSWVLGERKALGGSRARYRLESQNLERHNYESEMDFLGSRFELPSFDLISFLISAVALLGPTMTRK